MLKNFRFFHLIVLLFALNACTKEKLVNVLQDKYEPKVNAPEFTGEDFVVDLNANALQAGEHGEWKILNGTVVDSYVYFEDKTSPFTKFKGIPGEEYTLEWKRWTDVGNASSVQTKVKIPELVIEIADNTPSVFETIRTLSVNPKYRGTWSFEGKYAQLVSRYQDGFAEPPEKKPSVELHCYENTSYTATYKFIYAGKVYQSQKVVKAGNYTEDEGLYELQLSRGDSRIIEDNLKNILELNLQASGIAWIFEKPETYPALQAFKKLRKLILGGSSLSKISSIFGDYYLNLEELSMDMMGYNTSFPENFGNLTKLKILLFSPMNTAGPNNEILLPESFGNLKALESFTVTHAGYVDFNGTLGKLINLKVLKTSVLGLPEDIGNLKNLEYVDLTSRNSSFPRRFSECKSLKFLRLNFYDSYGGDVVLSPNIGDLKKLEFLEIFSSNLRGLPNSFSELSALKIFNLTGTGLQSIPDNFGNLTNLESLILYGTYTKIPNSFGNLTKLSSLVLGGKIETLPENFGNLSALGYFNAEYTNLKTLPGSIGKLKKLKELNLQQSKIETLPESFGDLDALEKLNLNATQLKTFPRAIIPLKAINNITFNGTNVGDIPDDLSKMRSGVVFNLYEIPNLTVARLEHIVSITTGKTFYTSFGFFSS